MDNADGSTTLDLQIDSIYSQNENAQDRPCQPCQDVKCQVALKAPHGTRFQYFPGQEKQVRLEADINLWLRTLFHSNNPKFDSYILYNDEPPSSFPVSNSSHHGHSKGVLAWNKLTISWLLHSAPKFPRLLVTDYLTHSSTVNPSMVNPFCFWKISRLTYYQQSCCSCKS